MTLANLLSFSRIPFLFAIVLCLMTPHPGFATAAVVLFLIAMLTDWLDGLAARLMNEITAVGALLDALIDKIFIMGLFIYFLHIRILPDWALLPLTLILARELTITGLRQCALLQNKVLAAESHGKLKTVLQFLSLFLLILAAFFQRDMGGTPQSLSIADFFKFFGRLTFAFAAFLTLTSGFYYLWRYRMYLGRTPQEGVNPS